MHIVSLIMFLLVFFFSFLLSCNCFVDRSLSKIEFKGFIYPYAIYTVKAAAMNDIIVFQSIATGQILPHLTLNDRQHLEAYKHIGSFLFPPNNFTPTQIIVKDNLFVIKNMNSNISWSLAYIKRPHLHRLYIAHNATSQLREYVSFFHRRQQLIKFEKTYLFDACELWRSWVFVRLEQTEQQFSIFLKRQPGGSSQKKFSFIKEYFTKGNVKKMFVQKYQEQVKLELVVSSEKAICLFYIKKDLGLVFEYCKERQYQIKEIIPIPASRIVVLEEDDTKMVVRGEIFSLQGNQTICSFLLPNQSSPNYTIYKVIHNRIITCAEGICHSYSFSCQKLIGKEQFVGKVLDIHYERIEHEYLEYVYSVVVIYTQNNIINFTECDDSSLFEQSVNMCRKPDRSMNTINQKYSLLNCYQCSRTPKCYFKNDKCLYLPNKEVEFFNDTVYQDKTKFIEHFSRFSAGITSFCPNNLNCSLLKNSFNSFINIEQNDQSPTQSTCQLILPISTESQYLIQLPNQNKFDVQVCYPDLSDAYFTCDVDDLSSIRSTQYKVYASVYILFIISAKSGGPNWNQLTVVNMYEKNLYNATMIFIEFAVTIVLGTLIVVIYAILKNRILVRLALWGWIQFRHTGKYPLSKPELQLKIKHFTKQGYLRQISSLALSNTKDYDECCFCLNQIGANSEVYQLFCRHQFHKGCLTQWFQLEPFSNKCPICKRQFNTYEVQLFNNTDHEFHRRSSDLGNLTELRLAQ